MTSDTVGSTLLCVAVVAAVLAAAILADRTCVSEVVALRMDAVAAADTVDEETVGAVGMEVADTSAVVVVDEIDVAVGIVVVVALRLERSLAVDGTVVHTCDR